jgi:hypothetical protein
MELMKSPPKSFVTVKLQLDQYCFVFHEQIPERQQIFWFPSRRRYDPGPGWTQGESLSLPSTGEDPKL